MNAAYRWMAIAVLGVAPYTYAQIGKAAPRSADKTTAGEFQATLQLVDGSKLLGTVAPGFHSLQVTSSLGELAIPLDNIRTVQFSGTNTDASVTLTNGDLLSVSVENRVVGLKTIFGRVSIPIRLITQLDVTDGISHTLQSIDPNDWEPIPFPSDSDWPGDKGQPPSFQNGEVILQGQDARSKQVYSLPITIEADVLLEERVSSDGNFRIRLIPEGAARDVEPRHTTELYLHYVNYSIDDIFVRGDDLPYLRLSAENWHLSAGQVHHVQLRINSASHWDVTYDGLHYTVENLPPPSQRFYIELYGWQPGARWHVKKFGAY